MTRKRKIQAVYEGIKAAAIARNRDASKTARDIGRIPPVADPARRQEAVASFLCFCSSYFPHRFTLSFSADHRRAAEKIETAVIIGGRFAFAMPRGRGKTTLSECATLWATITGRHRFAMLIGSAQPHAEQMLANLKAELAYNDALAEDFPEVCYPIRRLEGESRRCIGQLHHGRPTSIQWTADKIAYPVVPGSQASGAVIRTAGLLGNIRGAVHLTPDGQSIRPSLAIIDDPQTDTSASSPTQSADRERTIQGAVLGLAGPGESLAALMPCTIIRPGDLAARMLDTDQHPDWNGERFQQLKSFPKDMRRWEDYDEVRKNDLANGLADTPNAHELYLDHREEMDAGAEVDWPQAIIPGDASAIESTMRLYLADPYAFACERQNEPPDDSPLDKEFLTAIQIAARVGPTARREIPADASKLIVGIDVQKQLLYYAVAAVAENMTATIVDYGAWPEQNRAYYSLARAAPSLSTAYRGRLEARWFAGLSDLLDALTGNAWRRAEGGLAYVDRVLIDANYQECTDTVYKLCREHRLAGRLTPAHGRYVGAGTRDINDRKKNRGDIVGHYWRSPAVRSDQPTRYVAFDTNYWKTFVHSRLAQLDGDLGTWRLFKAKPARHRMLADHLTAEVPMSLESPDGRRVTEWRPPPSKPDNHLLDCVVLAAVGASIEGAALPEHRTVHRKRKRKRTRKAQVI